MRPHRETRWWCTARDKAGLAHRGWTRQAPWTDTAGFLRCGCCNDYLDAEVGCESRSRRVWCCR